MYYSQMYAQKEFVGKNMKDAYKKAVKWVATNVISKQQLKGTMVEYIKSTKSTTITVKLYIKLDTKDVLQRHWDVCREVNSLFYINQNVNCNQCSVKAYRKRSDDITKTKVVYYRELLDKSLKGEI